MIISRTIVASVPVLLLVIASTSTMVVVVVIPSSPGPSSSIALSTIRTSIRARRC